MPTKTEKAGKLATFPDFYGEQNNSKFVCYPSSNLPLKPLVSSKKIGYN